MNSIIIPDDNQRSVVFDTETTGLDSRKTDRIVEIAACELQGLLPTGRTYHTYCNPDRDIPPGAFKVHGLSRDFLRDKPRFRDVADDFLSFVGNDPLIAHNASFDFAFVNAELAKIGKRPLANPMIDTLVYARSMFPGMGNTLDDLCRRFKIDTSARGIHRADTDIDLLAKVYLELCGGRHRSLDFGNRDTDTLVAGEFVRALRPSRNMGCATQEEKEIHTAFLGLIKKPLWNQFEKDELVEAHSLSM